MLFYSKTCKSSSIPYIDWGIIRCSRMLLVVVCDDNKRCYNSLLHSHHLYTGIKKTGCVKSIIWTASTGTVFKSITKYLSKIYNHINVYNCLFLGNNTRTSYIKTISNLFSRIPLKSKAITVILCWNLKYFSAMSISLVLMRHFYEPVIAR